MVLPIPSTRARPGPRSIRPPGLPITGLAGAAALDETRRRPLAHPASHRKPPAWVLMGISARSSPPYLPPPWNSTSWLAQPFAPSFWALWGEVPGSCGAGFWFQGLRFTT